MRFRLEEHPDPITEGGNIVDDLRGGEVVCTFPTLVGLARGWADVIVESLND